VSKGDRARPGAYGRCLRSWASGADFEVSDRVYLITQYFDTAHTDFPTSHKLGPSGSDRIPLSRRFISMFVSSTSCLAYISTPCSTPAHSSRLSNQVDCRDHKRPFSATAVLDSSWRPSSTSASVSGWPSTLCDGWERNNRRENLWRTSIKLQNLSKTLREASDASGDGRKKRESVNGPKSRKPRPIHNEFVTRRQGLSLGSYS
jgi:hypothetical protein